MQARKRFASGISSPIATTSYTEESDSTKPIDRLHADAIMNYLTRIACQVHNRLISVMLNVFLWNYVTLPIMVTGE